MTTGNALFSLHPRFAEAILAGEKTVELRRRQVHISKGACIWFYASTPSKALLGRAWVEAVSTGSPREQWCCFSQSVALGEDEYLGQFSECEVVCAIQLCRMERFRCPLPLGDIRSLIPAFYPPQSYCWIPAGSAVETLFTEHVTSVGTTSKHDG